MGKITPSLIYRSKINLSHLWLLKSLLCSPLFCQKGRSFIKFNDVSTLFGVSESPIFISLIESTSCLVTVADISCDEDILLLIDIVKRIRVNMKFLFIKSQTLDYNLLRNKTINFKVFINHYHKGNASANHRIFNLKSRSKPIMYRSSY